MGESYGGKTAEQEDEQGLHWCAPAVYSQTGAQLMTNGFRVMLPKPYSSEVVHIEPQQ